MKHAILTVIVAALALTGCGKSSSPSGEKQIVIGFLVKQPEEKWFQLEWQFAQQCADKNGFKLVKIGATDGEKVLAAIDNLSAQGAQGFIICTPDVRLGPAIVAKAKNNNMKVLAVDDQFVGTDGKYMTDVRYLGISARNIGKQMGQLLDEEMKKRGWKADETGLCAVTFDELDTARDRTEGGIDALLVAGFPKEKVFRAPQKTTDIPGAFDAANVLLTQHPEIKRWLICGVNDTGVMGAVRAMEGRAFAVENMIGVGIGGVDSRVEFGKEKPTGFYGSIMLTSKRHGYDTTELMYKWIKDGVEPPPATFTTGIVTTRENYQAAMKEQGL